MFQLNEGEQRLLLRIARDAVSSYLSGRAPRFPEIPAGALNEPHGVFVSIHEAGELRGCIGNIHPVTPLYRATADSAVSAAVGDPRFAPLMAIELPRVDFEISVLSPMEKVDDINNIEVGRDGLLISKRTNRGLLLPQVAVAHGWDRERFLSETCRKAGLKPNDWKDEAVIFRFSAHVFHEQRSTQRK
jgi:uncharacterized protein